MTMGKVFIFHDKIASNQKLELQFFQKMRQEQFFFEMLKNYRFPVFWKNPEDQTAFRPLTYPHF
jgi:hypothetical protein